jgi:2-oxoglutarate ferredoxin oxidoreductase subunit alpha
MDYSILVGGEAGQGMDTFGRLLERILKRCGYYVFSHSDYMSRIRGGHNFVQIRFSDRPLYGYDPKVDIIFALSDETVDIHSSKLRDNGMIICDEEIGKPRGLPHFPLRRVAQEIGNPRVYTSIGLGIILKLFGLPENLAQKVIEENFRSEIAGPNIEAMEAGYNTVETKYELEQFKDDHIILNGSEALALGAIAAGCRFYCGYPMTPSTAVMTYMSSKSDEMGIVVDQVEDEVAALNMALGASYAGVRSMTGSSGGGFALMVEALSLAGMIETPVVIVNAQRPGPATGLPTRTEQADLRFVIHAGHGEFPRMVMALRSPEDAFYQAARAFNIADKYQIPVILMLDQHLADYKMTIAPFDFSKIHIERHIAHEEDIGPEEYKRYKITEDGISPRLIPGKVKGQTVLVSSDEHDEKGHITESAKMRTDMVNKRMRKLQGLKQEIQEPWLVGEENPENLIVCWGSTYGAVKEAVERLVQEGVSVGALVFGDIWPFPTGRLETLAQGAKRIIDIEQNATAQLEGIIREEALIKCSHRILKYDGRPFYCDELYTTLREEIL